MCVFTDMTMASYKDGEGSVSSASNPNSAIDLLVHIESGVLPFLLVHVPLQ